MTNSCESKKILLGLCLHYTNVCLEVDLTFEIQYVTLAVSAAAALCYPRKKHFSIS